MPAHHFYDGTVRWAGNHGAGTGSYTFYGREHQVHAPGVVVLDYEDHAMGTMAVAASGEGEFARVMPRPRVTITADSDRARR